MEEGLMKILTISTNRIRELTVTVKTLNETLNTDSPNDALLEAEINHAKLENSLTKLKNDLNNYFRLVNEPAIDDVSQITTIQLDAEEMLCELKIKIKRVKPSTSTEGTLNVSGKLPKLILSEFDGDILQWPQFWDQFVSQVDSRNLSDVDKLLYLNSALKGEARQLIDGFRTTNKNYSIAVTTLKARYGKMELVKDAHYSALNKITPAQSSVADCRRVLNDVERHLRVLSSLGDDTTHSFLRFLILEKFPEELVYELKKRVKEDSVLEIRTELENLISAKENANRLTSKIEQETKEYTTGVFHVTEQFGSNNFRQRYNNSYRGKQSSVNLPYHSQTRYGLKRKFNTVCGDTFEQASTSAPSQRLRRPCLFCNDNHFDSECYKVKTIEQRKAKLRNRCYICFETGHTLVQCKTQTKCRHCNQRHNTALCPRALSGKDPTEAPADR